MKVKLYLPWNNLGCLGLRIGGFYIDFYRTWEPWYHFWAAYAMFCRIEGRGKYRWSWYRGFRKVEI